ncbi:hypothetical protein FOMA001_g17915 [Fusarium oxysporum f. sp. matthiolae]|nr:hypothetical protein FOMA001_g17915 [Fusarium oxysporum f. sp. matthiolae]
MTEAAIECCRPTEIVPPAEPITADTPPISEPIKRLESKATGKSPFSRLAATPSAVNAFILHLHRCTRTRGGTDTVLLFTTYSARLIGAILNVLGRTSLRHSAREMMEQAFHLLPSTTVVVSAASAPPLAAFALSIAKRIRACTDMLGEWRLMNRLWGIISTYVAARDFVLRLRCQKQDKNREKVPFPDRFNTLVETLQFLLLFGYHISEASYWFSTKCIITLSPETTSKVSLYGARLWSTWVFLELGRLLVERSRRTPTGDVAAEEEWSANWMNSFIGILPWAPLSVHWGTQGGLLPEITIAALATWPASNKMRNLWRQTAESGIIC